MKNFLLLIFSLLPAYIFAQINPKNITIVRDQWGVPHIFAKTDAEVAYGLAWATAEDDFKTIQETLLPIKGLLGREKGVKGAVLDFAVQLMDLDQLLDAKYESDLSPEFRKITESYAQAMNAYAEKFPKEILNKKLFPVEGKDVIKGYVMALTLLSGVQNDLGRIISGSIGLYENAPLGSNAIAVNSNKTQDGQTYLAINPHQPLEGPYSWYEAHLVSEEGLNVMGATLFGGMHVFVGANENLAWTHTVNHPDFTDVYKLEMHKTEKYKYFFDGKWETLQEEKVKLKVKIFGFPLGVNRKFYRSKHGVVLKSKNGNFYAIRFPSNHTVKGAEQWYQMNKAKNFNEFKSALKTLGVCTTNMIYADKEDNIFYSSLGLFPKRNPKYDWKKVLPGHTSEVVWGEDFHSFDKIFQIKNPSSGYLGNCNHSPFNATAPGQNIDPSSINPTFGYMSGENNRSVRLHHLLGTSEKISYEDFKRIKFDRDWHSPAHVYSFLQLESLLHLNPQNYPKLADCISILNNWDRKTNIESEGAAIFALTYYYIQKDLKKKGIFPNEYELTETYLIERLKETRKHLKRHFKKINVQLGDLQQHIRGDKKIPIWGTPNVLAAMHGKPYKKGRFKIWAGESYVAIVRFTPQGVQFESIVPYGTSNHPESPHYDDQMEMYSRQELKKMTLNREEVLKNAKRTYHPE